MLASLAAGCRRRGAQCAALIDAVNAEQDRVVRALDAVGERPEAQPLEQVARAFEHAVQRVSAVPLDDAALRSEAVSVQGVLRRFASAVGAMAEAARTQDPELYERRRGELPALNAELGALVDRVNGLCDR